MSNATQLKKDNIRQVLQIVRRKEAVSKPEIAQKTGLTGATVQGIIEELAEQGVLRKYGFSPSKGGRKAQLYGLNGEYRYVAGVALRTDRMLIGVFDFRMEMLRSVEHEWDLYGHSVEETIYSMADFLNHLLIESEIERELLAGIGINVPGPVDYVTGKVISLQGYQKWRNVDLTSRLRKIMGLDEEKVCILDKDVNSGILLLKQLEKCPNLANILYISVEGGIGAGVIIGGQIYRGNHGVAGEIGHVTVQEDGERCDCGNVGCLELFSSDHAIIRKARKALKIADDARFTLDDAINSYREGLPGMGEIFAEATRHLATMIRNCFMIYDPDEIFIRCKWLDVNRALFFQLIDELYDNNTLIDRGDIKVSLVKENHFVLRSAAAIAWNNILESMDSEIYGIR